ncbi:hypothetical protein TruAng_004092 [Truncatella angustata]|nr:hypothetical protein TruAng_004092 [Truncatella angustata]
MGHAQQPTALRSLKTSPERRVMKPMSHGNDSASSNSFTSDSDDDSYSEDEDEDESSDGNSVQQTTGTTARRLMYLPDLLHRLPSQDDFNEIMSSPLFTKPVWDYVHSLPASTRIPAFSQYALLGASSDDFQGSSDGGLFYNITAPSSVFICGNQGSGKSHTLSCFLENCLVPSGKLGSLPRPLTGIVFHYDTFVSDLDGTPCEAAYLASHPNVNVRVLCPPTNVRTIKHIYSRLPGVIVEELRLRDSDLNTKRMLDLMAVGSGSMPLYMHVVQRVLRDMRIEQQTTGHTFNYRQFKRLLDAENLTPIQTVPLQQRLETLESFMVKQQDPIQSKSSKRTKKASSGTDWTPKAGQLTIVDLSCPCVTSEMACSLFNICLSLFLEHNDPSIGRVAALDEAHKYMGDSADAQTLTNTLLSTIRLQRHLALRVIISTQEPTISPKLLDLCNITIVHRFQSPDWLQVLKSHLAGLSTASKIQLVDDQERRKSNDAIFRSATTFDGIRGVDINSNNPTLEMMSHIVKLRTGEALIFAPSAFVGLERKSRGKNPQAVVTPKRLDHDVMRVRIRARVTADGGRSMMAI